MRPEHRAAAVHRPAIAVDPHDIDVAGALRLAFGQDARPFVDHRIEAAFQDFLIAYLAAVDALFGGIGIDDRQRFWIGGAVAGFVIDIKALAVLLAAQAGFAQPVAHADALGCLGAPADIQAGQIAHLERPHREAELGEHPVNIGGRRAFQHQKIGLLLAAAEHAVADEAIAHAGHHGDLAGLFAHRHRGGQHLRIGLGAAHHFKQAHDVGWREIMHAHHRFRPRGGRRDGIDIKVGGVAGQHGARLGDLVELGENLFLHGHVFKYGFDDQIAIGEIGHVQAGCEAAHARLHFVHTEPALLGAVFIIAADDPNTAIERFLLHFDDGYRDANRQEVHRNAAAHGASADHAHLVHRQRLHVGGQAVDLGRGALGEKHVALGGGLQAGHQLDELAALHGQAFGERQRHGGFDALDIGFRCFETAKGLGIFGAKFSEECRQRIRSAAQLGGIIAHLLERAAFGDDLPGKGDGASGKVTIDNRINQSGGQRVLAAHLGAAGDHFSGLNRANDARQALGAAGAGQQAQLDFGQAEFRLGIADAVVCAQRNLQAAAECSAVDGSDYRHRCAFHGVLHGRQGGTARRLAEFADIGAGNEGAAGAHQHSRSDGAVSSHGGKRAGQPVAHIGRQGVHRRRIDGDDGNIAIARKIDDVVDCSHDFSPQKCSERRRSSLRSALQPCG